ncbi:hypothetical protein A4G99_16615 [Haladaptatus sp. R4]|nr:hypothetical protein A4G99_16615 [Haladaptatus sp. R4]
MLTESAAGSTERDNVPTIGRDLLNQAQTHVADVGAAHFPDLPTDAIMWEMSPRAKRQADVTT